MNRISSLAALGGALLALSACTAPDGDPATSSAAATAPTGAAKSPDTSAVPAGLEAFYSQQIAWEECGTKMRCTDVEVPMDYENPDAKTITIRVKQNVSAGPDGKALLINPGGPGGSGVQLMDNVGAVTTKTLRGTYNVTGFDPRGVNESSAVHCLSDAERDADRAEDVDLNTDEGLDHAIAEATDYGKKCEENTGDLLGFVDTRSAARDMDILRAVIAGEPKLDYLGFSYGTFLGATYADLFPEQVGRFVLDGAIDPTTSSFEVSLGQAEGFDKAARAYIEDCQAGGDCPLTGTVDDAMDQLGRFFDSLRTNPLPTGDGERMLTRPLGIMGVITPLYSEQSWPQLTMGLTDAIDDGDGTILLFMADIMADRNQDGTYATNSDEAFGAINCLDFPVEGDMDAWRGEVDKLSEVSPVFGPELGYGDLGCSLWPEKAVGERVELDAAGAGPILVIGTTGDPATPYRWSEALAGQLDSGVLVTNVGEGHTAYGAGASCVGDVVDDYFVSGDVPEDGVTCE